MAPTIEPSKGPAASSNHGSSSGDQDDGSISPRSTLAAQRGNHGDNARDSSPKVRFSSDVSRAEDAAGVTVTDTTSPTYTSRTMEETQPTRTSGVPSQESLQHSSKTRNRGYSLRRSLFAQNIHKQNTEAGPSIEMTSPGTGLPTTLKSQNGNKPGKQQAMVSVIEDVGQTDELPANPVRLSDPVHVLPVYQRWLSKQNTRSGFIRRSRKSWKALVEKIFHSNPIPPSQDGRHVRVNCLPAYKVVDERTGKPHIDNVIRSCRYTLWNFLPRQLAAQFGKLANFYFLCISILQLIPGLSTTGTFTTIVPLMIFVGISMAKEGYDDIRRNRLDKEENEREVEVLTNRSGFSTSLSSKHAEGPYSATTSTSWRIEKWQNLRVGDVVLLQRDAPVPADVVLLHAHGVSGSAYIETKSLDGETNLKNKKPMPDLSGRCADLDALANLDAEFVVEDPNLDLYKFDGKVIVGGQTLPLTNDDVIYRSSVLRNTASAVGVVIYSGEECKIRMNANKNPRIKAPALQAAVNRVVILVAGLVFFIAIIMSIAYQIWRRTTERNAWYLSHARVAFGPILTSFIIMFNTMLPLSLYVSLEIVKVAQMFLMNDIDMYDPESDTPMEPHTSTINEELGQVSYIFSDKTGTLTNNSMRFRKMSIAGTAWLHDVDLQEDAIHEVHKPKLRHKKRGGKGKDPASRKSNVHSIKDIAQKSTASILQSPVSENPINQNAEGKPSAQPDPSLQYGKTEHLLQYISRKPGSTFARRVKFFILSLALCHTCMPEKDDEGNVAYQAASPDELALVTAAQDLGYIVTDRQLNTITVKTYPSGEDDDPLYEIFEIMEVIEFSSVRKRMSIVVRFPDQRLCLFTKGADTTIRKLLRLAGLASVVATTIERRVSERKSLEAQEAIRKKSLQLQAVPGNLRSSISMTAGGRAHTRNSSISLGKNHTARDSIDHWLKDRETDVDQSAPRRNSSYYSPRASAHLESPRASTGLGIRNSMGHSDRVNHSFHADDYNDLVNENLSDAAIFEHCFQHIDDFATEGLRTLLYAYKYISEEDYTSWKAIYAAAATSLVDRQEKLETAGALLETQLELLGATAIEDKLQKGVPDAIDRFRRAGIKMWMLTGDKRETAINIGHSCRLVKDYSNTVILDHESGNLQSSMENAVRDMASNRTAHLVIIVDGQTLTEIDGNPPMKALFTDLAIGADSVICCRASPSQKASLVRTIRTQVKGSVTLAIGDGANDIAMIQEAHLGIGIAGKEGLQAARTSDYSIGQFRFLLKLLLVHGRWNYIRVCKYTLGTFWKEMIFYLVQASYQRFNGYTGTSLYEPWSLSMFNTLFTSLPVIFMGVFEKDLAASTLLAVPELYSIGQRNLGFNFKLYVWWASLGAMEAMIVFFTMYSIYGEALFTRDNRLYAMGSLAYSSCVIIISLKLQGIELHNKSIAAAIAIFLSVGGWWLWNLILSAVYADNVIYDVNQGIMQRFGRNPLWWITLLLIVMAVFLFEITIKIVKALIWPTDVETFQAYEKDLEVRKRFEEAAADLLQQGWDRGTKKSSADIAREMAEQAEREAQVQELLERPRTMERAANRPEVGHDGTQIRRRHSGPTEDGEVAIKLGKADANDTPRRSVDVAELFSQGFGVVKKGPDLQ